jgi:hypothetical protein
MEQDPKEHRKQTRSEVEARFGALLDEERAAALSADLDRLVALQAAKQAVLDEADARGGLSEAAVAAFARRARVNLGLLRQLVKLQRGLYGLDAPGAGYGATGEPLADPVGEKRGAL